MSNEIINIHDTITYRPGFGFQPPVKVKVIGLTLTQHPREKYGQEVLSVKMADVKANKVLFDLDNGHWAYSEQVDL